ncbi:MAG TPA: FAD-dependent oxidoreductase [Vicinamibacterales bacterium]|nr:FAD-dependent oxidoreductase [Vicinamibacterales bacterium]
MSSRVIVLGGGVAGMSAAHELIERGFEVVVLERRNIAGGKARSVPVIDDGRGTSGHQLVDTGVASLNHRIPGEHGFRFFPGFYKHVIDTMRRIPSFDGRKAADHLVPTTRAAFTQYGLPAFEVPTLFPRTTRDAGTLLRDVLLLYGPVIDFSPGELAFFGARFWQLLTTCEERRLEEYERTSWWEFIGAAERSPAYQKFLATGFTRSLVASKAETASARTVGDMFVQMMMTIINPTSGSSDRVLDAPTNLAWIDPWRTYLESRGVQYVIDEEVEEIFCDGTRITGVTTRHLTHWKRGKRTLWSGDHYVAALPIERFAPMITNRMLLADPSLANVRTLAPNVEWMNGVQFYLKRDLPITHGHVIHIDTPWALTSISQVQFWSSFSPDNFGDDEIRGVISVDVSDWTSPGSTGRPAMECSREEFVREAWSQLKQSVNGEKELLLDEDLHSWFLDPDIRDDKTRSDFLRNVEPLLVNLENTWALRPEATTAIPNLFLASDYVRTYTDLATMEGANEAARRAVNGILDDVKFDGPRCEVWPLHQSELLAPWRLHDEMRFKAGLPWDDSLVHIAERAIGGTPLLEQVRPLLVAVAPFVSPIAEALDPKTQHIEDVKESTSVDAPLRLALVEAPALQDALVGAPGLMPGASEILGPGGFIERLGWYREMISDTLTAAVPTWEPQRHLYGLVSDFVSRSGKGLRPALCIATTRALGGRAEDAFPAAAGLEMLHNAFLVHDDIEDESESRRGVATMHRRVGIPIAVNVGDEMNALSMRLFRKAAERLGPVTAFRILDEVDHLLVETLEGQAMELGWVRDNNLTLGVDDYLRLVLKKTAWYSFIHPMRIGALIANGEDQNLSRFDRFGYLTGLAFQIKDDVLNLNGSLARYGKEIDGDLWEGKRTLMLTHAFAHANPTDRAWIGAFLERPRERRLPREIMRLHQIIEDAGSILWAQQAAAALAEAAAREFEESAFTGVPASPDLDWLRGCVDFLIQRDV